MKVAIASVRETFGLMARAPSLVKAGAFCGAFAGLSVGAMVSATAGLLLGAALGATVGVIAGVVMDREERRSSHRTKQLDDIIGVTSGSLGAPSSARGESSVREEMSSEELEREREQALKTWMTEWLTPPAPGVR
jgi:hypothetical protein